MYVCIYFLSGDKELIQEVLFDAVVTAPLEAYWTSLVLNKSECVTHPFTYVRIENASLWVLQSNASFIQLDGNGSDDASDKLS